MADFTAAERQALAKRGHALSDGSFPIRPGNAKDLENAIRDVGRASDPTKAKAYIIRRARGMGMKGKLPLAWL